MAEILIKAIDASHSNPDIDRVGCYKQGMPVVVKPDGHPWGSSEALPNFVVIKIPDISVDTIKKYIDPQYDNSDPNAPIVYRRRLWQIRWADLPASVKTTLATGSITIKAGSYSGSYDYTWQQVKSYFRNLETGQDETADL